MKQQSTATLPGKHCKEDVARDEGRSLPGCLAALVALAVLVGGGWWAFDAGSGWVSAQFSGSPEDYPGPGSGKVTFEVAQGETLAEMARGLKAEGVVASVDVFLAAAEADGNASSIQAGTYALKKEMRAADALAILLDAGKRVHEAVTVPEGLRVSDVVELLGKETDFPAPAWSQALKQDIGLPDYAQGNPEGYLFPATYELDPSDKPIDVLRAMVQRWRQAADEVGLEQAAARLGKTPAELMIIASLIEAEGRGEDMPRIARVIFNRLDGPGDRGGTNGRLQIDAAVAYGLGLSPGSTELTPEQLEVDTPYNTRLNVGLPPTPIEAPGDAALAAAADPADGPWYYYVTVDLASGETKFYEDYDGFLVGREEYKTYCETSDRC